LKQVFSEYQNANVISYCNTGHWAANNWFVLSELLGNKNVTLYDGSMVEWTSDISLPVDSTGRSNMDKIKGIIG
jgi:thiosulfate/3-mercaptopyruvate sulfurtransferase